MSVPTLGRLSLGVLLVAACQRDDDGWADLDEDVGHSRHALSYNEPGFSTTSNVFGYANRCAVDPVGDVASGLHIDPNYILAYRSGMTVDDDGPDDECDEDTSCGGSVPGPYIEGAPSLYHRQSIQRVRRNSKNYLFVSHSVRPASDTCWDPGFEVIEIGGAGHGTGYFNLGSGTGVTPTSPALCADHIVKYQSYSSTILRHAGGMQVNGSSIAVAFEDPNHAFAARFGTFNVSDPPNSFSGPTVARVNGNQNYAAAAALTRLNDSNFMVMVFGDNSADVEVFVSTGNTMPTAPSDWHPKDSFDFFGSDEVDYQNVQFVTRCSSADGDGDATSGRLYLLATYKNDSNEDYVVLYRVQLNSTTYAPTFTYETSRKLSCSSYNTGSVRYCDFNAGAGVFVDGDGRLIIYGVEHYNDHYDVPPSFDDHGVKVREFSTN